MKRRDGGSFLGFLIEKLVLNASNATAVPRGRRLQLVLLALRVPAPLRLLVPAMHLNNHKNPTKNTADYE